MYVSLFARLPPTRFCDIVASIALNRPGPLESGMVDDYVKVASGKTPVHYYDERLRPVLEETYGTMVYQEQIMQVSMVMSGFSAGKADKLRKAMGKKKLDVMRGLQEDWNTARSRTATRLRSRSRSGTTRRSSQSMPSTSRTRLPTPSWLCARRI